MSVQVNKLAMASFNSKDVLMKMLESYADPDNVPTVSDAFNCGKYAGVKFEEFFNVPQGHANWKYGLWFIGLDKENIKSAKMRADVENLTRFLSMRLAPGHAAWGNR